MGFRPTAQCWVGRQEQPAIRKCCQRTRLARPILLIRLHLLPALRSPLEQHPAAVIERLGVLKGFEATGEYVLADSHQARGAPAPHWACAIIRRLVLEPPSFHLAAVTDRTST